MNKDEFDSFFKVHSQHVDNSNSLGFWALTDTVLKTYLLETMQEKDGVTIIDFGGGTGRWLKMLDEHFTNSNFIIVDLSADMLSKAKEKVAAGVFKNKIALIESDISDISQLTGGIADYIISTYNPLSFVVEPQLVINEAHRLLKKQGTAMITIQGYFNALGSKVNNYLANGAELKEIFETKKVKWNPDVPALWQLPKADMENMFKISGFTSVSSRGIACITQPQGEDFDPENKQLGSLSEKLNTDKEFFDSLLAIELEIGKNTDATDRGMNIITIGTK